MAYFANSSEGACFEEECATCKYGTESCPIEFVQAFFNYDACNNTVAKAILDHLVKDNGECAMKKTFPKDLQKRKKI